MFKQTHTPEDEMTRLAEDARALMTATAAVAGDEVAEARKRLAAALERGKEFCGHMKDKAVESARAADQTVREHPYQAIAIGIGVGALLGYLLGSRRNSNRE